MIKSGKEIMIIVSIANAIAGRIKDSRLKWAIEKKLSKLVEVPLEEINDAIDENNRKFALTEKETGAFLKKEVKTAKGEITYEYQYTPDGESKRVAGHKAILAKEYTISTNYFIPFEDVAVHNLSSFELDTLDGILFIQPISEFEIELLNN